MGVHRLHTGEIFFTGFAFPGIMSWQIRSLECKILPISSAYYSWRFGNPQRPSEIGGPGSYQPLEYREQQVFSGKVDLYLAFSQGRLSFSYEDLGALADVFGFTLSSPKEIEGSLVAARFSSEGNLVGLSRVPTASSF